MKSVVTFSDLKLPTFWGITVNTALAPYQTLNLLISFAVAAMLIAMLILIMRRGYPV